MASVCFQSCDSDDERHFVAVHSWSWGLGLCPRCPGWVKKVNPLPRGSLQRTAENKVVCSLFCKRACCFLQELLLPQHSGSSGTRSGILFPTLSWYLQQLSLRGAVICFQKTGRKQEVILLRGRFANQNCLCLLERVSSKGLLLGWKRRRSGRTCTHTHTYTLTHTHAGTGSPVP